MFIENITRVRLFTALLPLYFFTTVSQVAGDSCADTVKPLHNLYGRARNNIAENGHYDPYINDFYLDDNWYSVQESGKQYLMPDSKQLPAHKTCGSFDVIYIAGTHPDLDLLTEAPIDVMTCLNSGFDKCDYRSTIKMRKCGTDVQYYLVRTPDRSAYCFDPPELQSVTDIEQSPDSVDLGPIKVHPELVFLNKTNEQNQTLYMPQLLFICSFQWQHENYFYDIFWYIHEKFFTVYGPMLSNKKTDAILHESTLLDKNVKMGFMINCGVRVRKSTTGKPTTMQLGQPYFAGIKLLTPNVIMHKGQDRATLQYQLTVPIGCKYSQNDDPCKVVMPMLEWNNRSCGKRGDMVTITQGRHCGLEFQALKRNDVWNSSFIYELNVTTTDKTYDDFSVFRVVMKIDPLPTKASTIWEGYQLDVATIAVRDNPKYKDKICFSHVDPHMKTADGYNYENHESGTYILYRNKKYFTEVQETVKTCLNNERIKCTCAVAIMAGADIFMINTCTNVHSVEFRQCENGGILRITNTTNKFTVHTPIGTKIDISLLPGRYRNFMNVDITMSAKDFNNVDGLCGNFDGNITNDLMLRDSKIFEFEALHQSNKKFINFHPNFTSSWKVEINESLFAPTLQRNITKWEDNNPLYCVCNSTSNSNIKTESVCEASQYVGCLHFKDYTTQKCKFYNNRKRSIHAKHQREIERLLRLSETTVSQMKIRILKRSVDAVNISEAEATSICRKVIEGSLAVREYSNHTAGLNPLAIVGQCAFDVQMGNSASLASVHVEALNNVVKTIFTKEINFTESNPEIIRTFMRNTCENNCSNAGICSDRGMCICHEHYHGADCRIDDRTPLNITDMEGGGMCNLEDGEECTCFYFRTVNLLPGFRCNVTGLLTYASNETVSITATDAGEQEDVFTGICCVHNILRSRQSLAQDNLFTTRYDIAVSNDGVHFGTPQSMVVYDSTCQAVLLETNKASVVLKDGFCYIDSRCVENGQSSIIDQNLVCMTSMDKYAWTRASNEKTDPASINVGLAVGLSVGLALVVVVIAVLVIKAFKRPATLYVNSGFGSVKP